jgi:predicted enzyme related to lactoylglutathione lyase
LALPDNIEDGAKRAADAGATMMGPVIEIPPGRLQYATDPDGNSIGLFEPKTM